jgi:hypothetical protein
MLNVYNDDGQLEYENDIDLSQCNLQGYLEVPVARRKSELSYFGVVGVSICSLSVILLLDFRTVPPV